MPHYQPGFTPEQFDALRGVIERFGSQGPFDANQVLRDVLMLGITNNAGDVAAILEDLEDMQILRRRPPRPGSTAPQWELVN